MENVRPNLGIDTSNSNDTEAFAHGVLRPILKQLNENLLQFSTHEIIEFHANFHAFDSTKKTELITNFFQKNTAFRNQLLGMLLGNISAEEMTFYLGQKRELNKRFLAMALQRVLSQLV
jgi:hypothetical protein